MDRSDVISLVTYTQTQDELGVWRESQTERRVYCKTDSVSRSEFFTGGQNGLKPEYRFSMFRGDYRGETTVIYRGMAYSVYRTYFESTDIIELYVERKAGVSNGPENAAC